jgi:uncharacterized membrane protein YccC
MTASAPASWRDSFRPSAQPWAWWAAGRTVIAGAVIGAFTLGLGNTAAASVAYFAVACSTSFSVTGSPTERVRNTVGQAIGAVVGLVLAGILPHDPVVITIVAVVAGFVSGVSQRFARASVTAGALMLLVALAFGVFAPTPLSWPLQALWYGIGAALVAVLAALPLGRAIPAPALRTARADAVAVDGPPRSPHRAAWQEPATMAGVRLALCFGIAMLLAATLDHGRHSYWLPLTTAVVMRAEYGPVTSRVVARTAGTLLGALVAAAVVLLLPADATVAAAAVLGMAGGALAASRLYALTVVGITISALLAGEIGIDDPVTPLVRVGDTLLGCLIALVFGSLLWALPSLLRRRHG